MNQSIKIALDDKSLLHSVVWACRDIILQAFPRLGNGLVCELLKARDLILEDIGFSELNELGEKCIGAFLLG
jgi:hypothetical protein